MMKTIAVLILVCACCELQAQTNFVKNPGFEEFSKCPVKSGTIYYANHWRNPFDSILLGGSDYHNVCADTGIFQDATIPVNGAFYQETHFGNGMVGTAMYYDKTLPPPPSHVPFDSREYTQGHLFTPLKAGQIYCLSFWVNLAEGAGYGHNNIGAYLDDGGINGLPLPAGSEITSVIPQVFTSSIISDTGDWTKIEGSFIATGNESYITIGLFSTNALTSRIKTNYYFLYKQQSYYLIDDVSVIPIDLAADAGKDSHAELGKTVQIGRVGDTTAQGLDCKWYRKGLLIDSGAIISVNAGATVGAIDTYVVVQTICGLVKTDTVTVKTVPVGIPLLGGVRGGFSVYPNPSNGSLTITPHAVIPQGSLHAKVYDFLGRVVYQKELSFSNNEASINLNAADGIYILELSDSEGNSSKQRIEIRN